MCIMKDGEPQLMNELIRHHWKWQNLHFWQHYFREKVVQELGVKKKEDLTDEQKQSVASLLQHFAHNMEGWANFTTETIQHFACNIADIYNLCGFKALQKLYKK
eukprot:TRINITY_DN4715_c0_g1_i1.p1 TRINITY_DN4715_c0_g1~~TRINITY_DN4715_c0_g1_i1.p1  ORF type:complete len:104 (+),score=20.91 TRINITY_DN4715_c0_g1_i1:104-415(+)